jgi:ribosomal protein L12E/L44/L45/RPP1/RPP2
MPIERVRMDGARIRQVVSELTGKPCGEIIEHKSGRVDATARPPTVEIGRAHV